MSEQEPEQQDSGGQVWSAPNQQVVREDESGPWDEGTGGEPGELAVNTAVWGDEPAEQPAAQQTEQQPEQQTGEPTQADLDAMTKEELLGYARQLGVSPANNDMTKEQLRAGVDAKLAER